MIIYLQYGSECSNILIFSSEKDKYQLKKRKGKCTVGHYPWNSAMKCKIHNIGKTPVKKENKLNTNTNFFKLTVHCVPLFTV